MTRKAGPPALSIVGSPDAISAQPLCPLGEHGRCLWEQVTAQYDVSDPSGIAMLTQACIMLDRAATLSTVIADEGELIRTARSVKVNPAIAAELSCRNSMIRALQKLGLNYEPLRTAPGRPPGRR